MSVLFRPSTFLHGADYNPEQWLDYPEVLKEDLRLMPLAGMNVMAVGIFSWAMLEPEEGVFNFAWLDKILDDLHRIGVKVILATPSGARPAWMVHKYPEVQRVNGNGQRHQFGGRHNHCYTSPLYRAFTTAMNERLAQRYGNHPALLMWHVSNEYAGGCHCSLCEGAFREWLKARYGTLDALNAAWWTTFWSARYQRWDDIQAPAPQTQWAVNAYWLDWNRFVSDRTIDFYKSEVAPLRRLTPTIPVTTNFHPSGTQSIDHWRFAREVDVVAWDNYPFWGHDAAGDYAAALKAAFDFDLMRSLHHAPFLMMESTPSTANWHPYSTQKPAGLALLSALQAVAHGSDSVQYFQWRKGRGAFEKFHGAIIDHVGHENTRVFRDTQAVTAALEKLRPSVLAARTPAPVGLYYDWDSVWALAGSSGPAGARLRGFDGVKAESLHHYRALVENRVNVEFHGPDSDLAGCQFLVVPASYLLRLTTAQKFAAFVAAGGTLVVTYLTATVGESDLCHLGGFPGAGLRELLGVWAEELHPMPDHQTVEVRPENAVTPSASAAPAPALKAQHFIELLHANADAEVLARFADGPYAGSPAATRRRHGQGQAIYLGAKLAPADLRAWLSPLLEAAGIERVFPTALPEGVYATRRGPATFLMNFSRGAQTVALPSPARDLLSDETRRERLELPPYGLAALKSV